MAPKKHFVFFVFPAYGHIIPLMELAKRTSQRHKVSFVLTKSYLNGFHARNLLLPPYDEKVKLIGLEDGIPEDRDKVYPTPGMRRIVFFAKQMEKSLSELLEASGRSGEKSSSLLAKPDVVITDKSLTSVIVPLCQKLAVPCYLFNPDPGFDIAATLQVDEHTPTVEQNAKNQEELIRAETPATNAPIVPCTSFPCVTDDYKDYLIDVNRYFHHANGIIINNFRESDPDAFAQIQDHHRIKAIGENFKIFCVGPLFPPETLQPKNNTVLPHITAWLNGHEYRSVLYISFGTIVSLQKEQLAEIANAVCDDRTAPFSTIWSLPEKLHPFVPKELLEKSQSYLNGPVDEILPKVLILSWTPQKYILCHPSTRLYLTHAGWNSTIEGVTCGVAMVAFPLCSDQHANAAWICKNGVGFCIPDTKVGKDARTVPTAEIIEALEHVGDWEKSGGNLYSEQVQKWAERVRIAIDKDGSSWKDIERLLDSA